MPESETTLWRYPVGEPLFTDALLDEWVEKARTEPRKPKAFDTRLRFSDAGGCTRALAYGALGYEGTPMDAAGIWVTGLGTIIHELLQGALERRFPGCRVEVKAIVGTLSGHCDLLVTINGVLFLYELKTTGAFAFDKAIGLKRKSYKQDIPEGPRNSAILQAGINAIANGATEVVIGYIAMEAVSVPLAEKIGMGQKDRVMAEWYIPQEVWRPRAQEEIDRQTALVLDVLDRGRLPIPEAIGDNWEPVALDPKASRTAWNCNYCRFRTRCEADGCAEVAVPVELKKAS